MLPTHKKNRYRISFIMSKFETNRQKIYLILRSTSFFSVFPKIGGDETKNLFLVFLFNVTTKGYWMILFTTGPFAHTTHPNKIYSRLLTIMGSYIVPIFVILGCTRFLVMCQESIPPPKKFCFCFSIVLPLTSSFVISYISGGG